MNKNNKTNKHRDEDKKQPTVNLHMLIGKLVGV